VLEIIDIIFRRRSLRQFTPAPVERETRILLLKAAMSAPTACNSQPREFIVVTEPDVLARIRGRFCSPDITRRPPLWPVTM
jgi:nitroreductase